MYRSSAAPTQRRKRSAEIVSNACLALQLTCHTWFGRSAVVLIVFIPFPNNDVIIVSSPVPLRLRVMLPRLRAFVWRRFPSPTVPQDDGLTDRPRYVNYYYRGRVNSDSSNGIRARTSVPQPT